MSANSDNSDDVQTHSIEANDNLIKSVILDQNGDLVAAWREAFQNIIDSMASEGRLEFDHSYTRIVDNGQGVELTEEKGIQLLTVMGESSKDADDHSTIGEFGVGGSQVIAKGRTVFISGDTALMFDIKGWGLEAKTVPLSDASSLAAEYNDGWANLIDQHFGSFASYDGLAVLVDHYEDEVPDEGSYKWSRFGDNIHSRFKYLNNVDRTKLYVNDELITDLNALDINGYGSPTHTEVYESEQTGPVHIAVKHGGGTLTVYSGGIKVTDVDSRGISGQIVTERNLELNFARNEIKSGCPIWSEISDRLDEIRAKVFNEVKENRLNDSARKFISDRMFNHGERDEYSDAEVFETASEDMVSWDELSQEDEVGMASKGNPAADKLQEAYGQIVLNENDSAVQTFDDHRDDLDDAPEDFDAQIRAENNGLHTTYEEVDERTLKPTQQKQLGIARYIVDEMGVNMDVRWGESDVAAAWTDGNSYIVLTETAAKSSQWIQWVPELWETVVHELAHNVDTSDTEPSHGISFNRSLRENIEKEGGIEALSHIMGKISEKNLTRVAEIGHAKAE